MADSDNRERPETQTGEWEQVWLPDTSRQREGGEREGEGSSNNGLERESDNVEKVRVVLYVGEQGADNTREQRN